MLELLDIKPDAAKAECAARCSSHTHKLVLEPGSSLVDDVRKEVRILTANYSQTIFPKKQKNRETYRESKRSVEIEAWINTLGLCLHSQPNCIRIKRKQQKKKTYE